MENYKKKYQVLLSEKYPSKQSVCREIINLNAILNLPKGTEHFMSDLHGEYEAFYHILNNCAGVIREKVDFIFKDKLSDNERQEICTLIYYPVQKLNILKKEEKVQDDWYRMILNYLIAIAKHLSSKYTRSKVRKALPSEFSYIIDELLHVQQDEDNNQVVYHQKIIDTIIRIQNSDEFIVALAGLIKRLAVDHLHIIGDIFDRGEYADKIIDLLMVHHSLDIEWGNHDIQWMGAVAGSEACIASVIRSNLKHHNMKMLENGYGISLLSLTLFAEKTYPDLEPMEAALKAITIILFKLEGQIIERHPEYEMDGRKLLHKIDYENKVIEIEGTVYSMKDVYLPTVNRKYPYKLTKEEENIITDLKNAFANSYRLRSHIEFLYAKGSMYLCYNQNLLYHGCIPLDQYGNFEGVEIGGKIYKGKAYLDYAEKIARRAYNDTHSTNDLDFMWYLWCGIKSPLSGRKIKTFEKTFIEDPKSWIEDMNYYFKFYTNEITCCMILREFDLYSFNSHIINGHTPVKVQAGENPVQANGRLIIIDGGFCKAYHKTTGIAGYTLIYNSHGMRLKSHQPFETIEKALAENKDIESNSVIVETKTNRVMVMHTDIGKRILEDIDDLQGLLYAYRQGEIKEKI